MTRLPPGWARAPFDALLAETQNGCGIRTSTADGVPTVVLRLADVSLDGEIADSDLRTLALPPGDAAKYALQPDDLLFFRVNGSRDITGHAVCYEGPAGYAYCDHFIRARVNRDGANSSLIARAFREQHVRGQVEQGMVSTAGQNTISQATIRDVTLLVPPRPEQDRIVRQIQRLEARGRRAKAALDAVPALLERLRQSILAAAFRGNLTADWRAKRPALQSGVDLRRRILASHQDRWETFELAKLAARRTRIDDDRWRLRYQKPQAPDVSALPELPASWCWATLDELCAADAPVVYGIIQPGEHTPGGVPYVRPIDIRSDGTLVDDLRRTTPEIAASYSRAALIGGDVVLSIVGTIGKVAVIPDDLAGANITQSSVRIRPGVWLLSDYVGLVLQSPVLVRQYGKYRFGNAVQRLNVEHVRQLAIPVPPLDEASEIVSSIHRKLLPNLRRATSDLQDRVASLDRAILAKAFRGELVPQDPTDEPADVMLARLRAEQPAQEKPARKKKAR